MRGAVSKRLKRETLLVIADMGSLSTISMESKYRITSKLSKTRKGEDIVKRNFRLSSCFRALYQSKKKNYLNSIRATTRMLPNAN